MILPIRSFPFSKYLKIPIISPGRIFVQKAVLLGLCLGELIFGGAYYGKEFFVSKWVGLDNKMVSSNSLWAYIWEGLLSEGFFRLRFFWGGGLLLEFHSFNSLGCNNSLYKFSCLESCILTTSFKSQIPGPPSFVIIFQG